MILVGFCFGVAVTLGAVLVYLWLTGELVEDEREAKLEADTAALWGDQHPWGRP